MTITIGKIKYIKETTKPEMIDLSEMRIGDSDRIELCGVIGGTTELLLTKIGDNKISIVREFWFEREKTK